MQADYSLEDDAIDKIYAEHSKNELWGIVERFTSDRENGIIKEIFINNQTMAAVAREQGISLDRIRQIKEKGLRKLRRGKARRELLRKFDIAEKSLYRGGFRKYSEHNFTSAVEYIAIRKIEAEKRYRKHLEWIEKYASSRLQAPQSHGKA